MKKDERLGRFGLSRREECFRAEGAVILSSSSGWTMRWRRSSMPGTVERESIVSLREREGKGKDRLADAHLPSSNPSPSDGSIVVELEFFGRRELFLF